MNEKEAKSLVILTIALTLLFFVSYVAGTLYGFAESDSWVQTEGN